MNSERRPDELALPNRRATKRLAKALGAELRGGDLIVLSGSLGAGKTFLVRALCRALGLDESVRVVSPTFTLVRELPTDPPILHADLYRLGSTEEAWELGLWERRDRGEALIVEWGAAHREALGADALEVSLSLQPRRATLNADGPRSRRLREAALSALCEPSRRQRRETRPGEEDSLPEPRSAKRDDGG